MKRRQPTAPPEYMESVSGFNYPPFRAPTISSLA